MYMMFQELRSCLGEVTANLKSEGWVKINQVQMKEKGIQAEEER